MRAVVLLATLLVASAQPLYNFDATSPIVQLTDDNFDELMSGDTTSVWVVEYYADWCVAVKPCSVRRVGRAFRVRAQFWLACFAVYGRAGRAIHLRARMVRSEHVRFDLLPPTHAHPFCPGRRAGAATASSLQRAT